MGGVVGWVGGWVGGWGGLDHGASSRQGHARECGRSCPSHLSPKSRLSVSCHRGANSRPVPARQCARSLQRRQSVRRQSVRRLRPLRPPSGQRSSVWHRLQQVLCPSHLRHPEWLSPVPVYLVAKLANSCGQLSRYSKINFKAVTTHTDSGTPAPIRALPPPTTPNMGVVV